MKIIILDNSQEYMDRFAISMEKIYGMKVQIWKYTDAQQFIKEAGTIDPDIVLKGNQKLLDDVEYPLDREREAKEGRLQTIFICLVENKEEQQGYFVYKWQSIKAIYKKLVSIKENYDLEQDRLRQTVLERKRLEEQERLQGQQEDVFGSIIVFMGAVTCSGCSTAALGLAKKKASEGKKILYLNWREFNSHAYFAQINTMADFTNVLYAVKNQQGDINTIISNSLCMDQSKICYFHNQANWNANWHVEAPDLEKLLGILRSRHEFDSIIIDTPLYVDEIGQVLCKYGDQIVFTSNGCPSANQQLIYGYQVLQNLSTINGWNLKQKEKLLYTCFHNQQSQMITNISIQVIGGVPFFANKMPYEIIDIVSKMEILNEFL